MKLNSGEETRKINCCNFHTATRATARGKQKKEKNRNTAKLRHYTQTNYAKKGTRRSNIRQHTDGKETYHKHYKNIRN